MCVGGEIIQKNNGCSWKGRMKAMEGNAR
jgi:hypothetical protein